MDLEKVKEFITLAKDEGVAELKYEEKDLKISVNFNASTHVVSAPAMAAPMANTAAATAPASAGNQSSDHNYHVIKSPFVGTFYSSPAPDKPSFVNVGDKVSKGQTLCILEAMKIMNEIESDITGEIVEVCVENESLVEFGQELYKIKA
ncbi:MAG: acetyl-CoA carboxylase, biotin carboxyl carrier protein [Halobacteriovoraceae bacterium]|nr:acetyl-CoA carboxylase, biotin carboxyl carrier protein [Halobacteriovoraceae bacterium]|tara:strand:+ start:960 stop:1406 length:447 start_codon:yes stop_codon:yes gene_type:complete